MFNFKSLFQTLIQPYLVRIKAYVDSVSGGGAVLKRRKFSPLMGQTSFSIGTDVPKGIVCGYINGRLIDAFTVSGSSVDYNPAVNGNYQLESGDEIIFIYLN